MARIEAREVFIVAASDSERRDRKSVYPSSVEFDTWPEAVEAMQRTVRLGFEAILSREVIDDNSDDAADHPDLADWPSARHVVSTEEYWRRYWHDHPKATSEGES